jgi:hypothetical protein
VSAVGNRVREYGRWYLASCFSVNKENIFSLDDFSARGIRDIALLIGPRKVSQTCDIAEFPDGGLGEGISAHVDCAKAVLKDVVVGQVEFIVIYGGRNHRIIP